MHEESRPRVDKIEKYKRIYEKQSKLMRMNKNIEIKVKSREKGRMESFYKG